MKRRELSRLELYREIWRRPVTKVATEFGLSDNGLRKICRALGVPLPPRGHWAKLSAGKPSQVPELPPHSGATTWLYAPRVIVDSNDLPSGEDRYIGPLDDIAPSIDVPEKILSWHPLIERSRRALSRRDNEIERILDLIDRRNRSGWYRNNPNAEALQLTALKSADDHVVPPSGSLFVLVSIKSRERALQILDTLLKALSERQIRARVDGEQTVIYSGQAQYRLRLSEASRGTTNVQGIARLRVTLRNVYGADLGIRDESNRSIEAQLGAFVSRIVRAMRTMQTRIRETAMRRKAALQEEEQKAKLRAEDVLRADELRAKCEAERKARVQIVDESSAWLQARTLRAYVRNIQRLSDRDDPNVRAWVAFALRIASSMDPTTRRLLDFQSDQNLGGNQE